MGNELFFRKQLLNGAKKRRKQLTYLSVAAVTIKNGGSKLYKTAVMVSDTYRLKIHSANELQRLQFGAVEVKFIEQQ